MAEAIQVLKPLVVSSLNPAMNITVVADSLGLAKLASFIEREGRKTQPMVGLDTETNLVHDFWTRRVRLIQIGNREEQYVIDLLAFAGSEAALMDSQGDWGVHNGDIYKPVFDVIDPVINTNKFLKLGVNLGFEYEVFHWNFGRRIWHLFSNDLAERVIWAGGHSLKDYDYYSMASIFGRYFGYEIDKSKQQSFDLKSPLTWEQIEYAAFDVRAPFSMRDRQMEILTKDQLLATNQIEQDAIGSYTDMHLFGMSMDSDSWLKRIDHVKSERVQQLKVMDETFIPIVGRKDSQVDFDKLEKLENIWRTGFEVATQEEMDLAYQKRIEKDPMKKAMLGLKLNTLSCQRKQAKQEARQAFMEVSKHRTYVKNMVPKCEGEAFINYSSNTQMLAVLNKLGFSLEDMQDESLLVYNDHPLIKIIRKYRKGDKAIGTYGEQWTKRWTTKPCKEEGFLHPMDGKLHPIFNQLEAETGRSSSGKPSVMNLPKEQEVRSCFICDPTPPGTPEEDQNVIVTVDMSGAELRILAELADCQTWINAFAKGQDVHAIGTELMYPQEWPKLTCKGGEKWFDPEKQKEIILPPCAYFQILPDGTVAKKKCKCPGHQEKRNGNKAVNFMVVYGGGPPALADELDISLETATDIMNKHKQINPDLWAYLDWSGKSAKQNNEARDMYGRRRQLPPPTPDVARQWIKDEYPEKIELAEEVAEANIEAFKKKHLRNPTKEERFEETHREPDRGQIKWAMRALWGSRERQGKNHCIQGTNASIIKRAMGCGVDKDGKGYLWHLLPLLGAKLLSMVHDELIIQCTKKVAQKVVECVADAFRRAAAEVMKKVVMESDFHIAGCWQK